MGPTCNKLWDGVRAPPIAIKGGSISIFMARWAHMEQWCGGIGRRGDSVMDFGDRGPQASLWAWGVVGSQFGQPDPEVGSVGLKSTWGDGLGAASIQNTPSRRIALPYIVYLYRVWAQCVLILRRTVSAHKTPILCANMSSKCIK
jgi:hypothetical protein